MSDCNVNIGELLSNLKIPVDCEGCSGAGEFISYSTEEQFTGKYWIDGKKIYQKTIHLNAGGTPYQIYTTPHNIQNLDRIVKMDIINFEYFDNAEEVRFWELPYSWGVNSSSKDLLVGVYANRESINLQHTINLNYDPYATVLYTCTDR